MRARISGKRSQEHVAVTLVVQHGNSALAKLKTHRSQAREKQPPLHPMPAQFTRTERAVVVVVVVDKEERHG
jgi:hypothetical protein